MGHESIQGRMRDASQSRLLENIQVRFFLQHRDGANIETQCIVVRRKDRCKMQACKREQSHRLDIVRRLPAVIHEG